MKFATIMKEALAAVTEAGCAYEGPGVCRCCEARVGPAHAGLESLDDATVARMDWAAGLEPQDVARIAKALELAGEASERFGSLAAVRSLRGLRCNLEDLL